MDQGALLRADPFSSSHLGMPVYRLADPARAAEAVQWTAANGGGLIEARLPATAVAEAAALTALQFAVIDINIQLDTSASVLRRTTGAEAPAGVSTREAGPGDRPAVERIAASALVTSRFHLDPKIDARRASALKAAWAGNFFDGRRGERLLVAEKTGAVCGFLQVLERGAVGTIDLIAVDTAARGSGAFAALIHAWLERAPALETVIVGTQVSNVRSLRSYNRIGFRVASASLMLHHHS